MNILKIEKKHIPAIMTAKFVIESHQKCQDNLIKQIAKRMGVKTAEEQEILWDYICNDSEWMVEIVPDTK